MSSQFDQEEVRELYRAVALGFDVVQFIKSPVGQYLLLKAEEERVDALADLVDAQPEDTIKIRALQSSIKRAESLRFWLEEAIEAGKNAQAQLDPDTTPES